MQSKLQNQNYSININNILFYDSDLYFRIVNMILIYIYISFMKNITNILYMYIKKIFLNYLHC